MENIKLAAFDLEGVLFDWHKGIESISKTTNVKYDTIHNYLIKRHSELELGKITEKEFWSDFILEYKLFCKAEDLIFYWVHSQPKISKNWELAKEYKNNGIKLAIVSNSWPTLIYCLQKIYPDFVIFDYIFESHKIGYTKPSIEFFKYVENKTGFTGNEILIIDDSEENLQGAKKMGWQIKYFLVDKKF